MKTYNPRSARVAARALALMLLAGGAPAAPAQTTTSLPLVLPVPDGKRDVLVFIINFSDVAGTARSQGDTSAASQIQPGER